MKISYSTKGKNNLIISLVLVTLLLGLTGCVVVNTSNYLRKYDEYLEYSLGDFAVIESGMDKSTWIAIEYFRYWDIEYKNDKGEYSAFGFRNDISMESQVEIHAANLGTTQVMKEIQVVSIDDWNASIYYEGFDKDTEDTLEEYAYIGFEMHGGSDEQLLDTKKGLKLRSVTAHDLVNDWGFTFNFDITVYLKDARNFATVYKKFLPLFCYTADYLGCDKVPFEFTIFEVIDGEHDYYGSVKGTYSEPTDSAEWDINDLRGVFSEYFQRRIEEKIQREFADILDIDAPTPIYVNYDYSSDFISSDIDVNLAVDKWITPPELVRNWGCMFGLEAKIKSHDKKRLNEMARSVADYFEQDSVTVTFDIEDNDYMKGCYNRLTDSIEWE